MLLQAILRTILHLVCLLNETHYVGGLQVGDVTRETIELTGVAAGEYAIDFVSYT